MLFTNELITISFGKELYCPIPYNSFEVGPLSVTVNIRKGETYSDAASRARSVLCELWQQEYESKRQGFFERQKEVLEFAKTQRGGSR